MAERAASAPSALRVTAVLRRDDFVLDIELNAAAGEVVGLAGDIGAGKSSLLRLVAGELRAESGIVAFDGRPWDEPATGAMVTDRPLTMVSQAFRDDLAEDRTGTEIVSDTIELIRRFRDGPAIGRDGAEERARNVLAELGVADHVVDRLPWTFSGAEAQRVALAAALAPEPSVLLLDEPLGALDIKGRASVRAWLADWLDSFDGVTLIASTSEDDLSVLADRVHRLG